MIRVTCLPTLETGQLSNLEGLVVLDPSLQDSAEASRFAFPRCPEEGAYSERPP